VELGVINPVLGARRDEGFLPRQSWIEDRFQRMAEDVGHFVLGGFQSRYNRWVGQQSDDRRHDEPVERDEGSHGPKSVDIRRIQRKADFLVCLPILKAL
jgi:hypothetical protein